MVSRYATLSYDDKDSDGCYPVEKREASLLTIIFIYHNVSPIR